MNFIIEVFVHSRCNHHISGNKAHDRGFTGPDNKIDSPANADIPIQKDCGEIIMTLFFKEPSPMTVR